MSEEQNLRSKAIEAAARAIKPHLADGIFTGPAEFEEFVAALALDAILAVIAQPDLETLRAGYEAMFADRWTGSEAPMIGAGFDAMIGALLSEPTLPAASDAANSHVAPPPVGIPTERPLE